MACIPWESMTSDVCNGVFLAVFSCPLLAFDTPLSIVLSNIGGVYGKQSLQLNSFKNKWHNAILVEKVCRI